MSRSKFGGSGRGVPEVRRVADSKILFSASASDDARVVRRTTGDRLTRRRSSRGRATARGATHAAIAACRRALHRVRADARVPLPTTTFHNENILSENVWCDDVIDQNSRRVRLDRAR